MLGHYTTAPGLISATGVYWKVAGRMIPEIRAGVNPSELPIFEAVSFLLRRSLCAPGNYVFFTVLYNEKGKTCFILLLYAF